MSDCTTVTEYNWMADWPLEARLVHKADRDLLCSLPCLNKCKLQELAPGQSYGGALRTFVFCYF